MAWNYWACDPITGARLTQFTPRSWSMSPVLNDTGSGSVTINLTDLTPEERIAFAQQVGPDTILVQSWVAPDGTETAISAGYQGQRDWNLAGTQYTAPLEDLWGMLDTRVLIGVGDNPNASRYVLTNKSFNGTVHWLLRWAQNNTESLDELPILLPPDTAGPKDWDWRGYNTPVVGDVLRDIAEEETGPEIWLRPAWNPADSRFRWEPELAVYLNATHRLDFNLSGEGAALQGEIRENTADRVSRVFAVGEGSGSEMLMRAVVDNSAGLPTRERVVQFKDVKTYAQLLELGRGHLAENLRPWHSMTLSIRADGGPAVPVEDGTARPGPTVLDLKLGCKIAVQLGGSHPAIPGTEWQVARLAGFDVTEGANVTLHLYY